MNYYDDEDFPDVDPLAPTPEEIALVRASLNPVPAPAAPVLTYTTAEVTDNTNHFGVPGTPEDSSDKQAWPNPESEILSRPDAGQQAHQPPQKTALPQLDKLHDLSQMRRRFTVDEPFNNLVRDDWQKAIEGDPFAFDALLFLPEYADRPADSASGFEKPEFTEINANQRELTYGDPVVVTLLDCPDERDSFYATDSDQEDDGNVDDFLVVRSSATGIPIGSVLGWFEKNAAGQDVPRWWYVLKIFAYGSAKVGSLYFMIPARNFPEQQQAEATHALD